MTMATTIPAPAPTREAPEPGVVVTSGIALEAMVLLTVRVAVAVEVAEAVVEVATTKGAEKLEPTWLVMVSEVQPLPSTPEALVKRNCTKGGADDMLDSKHQKHENLILSPPFFNSRHHRRRKARVASWCR